MMRHVDLLLDAENPVQDALPLSARLIDLGPDAYTAGYRIGAEHLFCLAEQMMEHPRNLE